MNYSMPYLNYYPSFSVPSVAGASKGLFSKIFGSGLSFSSILSGTQKTLGIVNQALPIIKQVTPTIKNAKTMFRVMNEFKKVDIDESNNSTIVNNTSKTEQKTVTKVTDEIGPTFFLK